MTTATAWAALKERFDTYSDDLNAYQEPINLYEPVKHIMSIGGKRIRPMLLLLANEAFNGDTQKALPIAYAFEIFHNFTLVHDDIMDEADLRRGEPTVHNRFGTNAAILSGDVMVAMSYDFLSNVPSQYLREALQIFNDTAIGIMEGQQQDMDMEGTWDSTEDDYLDMIKKKTAILLAAALETGSLIAGASEADRKIIYEFGINAGLAFQIRDDFLDAYGDARVGKTKGGDILQDKRTWLMLKALEVSNPEQEARLHSALENLEGQEKIDAVMAIFEELNIPDLTQAKMDHFTEKAFKNLDQLSIPMENTAGLRDMAGYLLGREY